MNESKIYVIREMVDEFTGHLITEEQALELLDALYEVNDLASSAFVFEKMPHKIKQSS